MQKNLRWRLQPTLLRRQSGSVCTSYCFSTAKSSNLKRVKVLDNWDVAQFRSATANLQAPALLSRKEEQSLPACTRWFHDPGDENKCTLDQNYLGRFGECMVPLELTSAIAAGHVEFRRTHAPLSLFLRWTKEAPIDTSQRIYLAQCQLMDLPDQLKGDLPTPQIILEAGKGDVYDSNIWMGRAPTYTPLHRDPNPNLFYQLAGKKVVRLFPPEMGDSLYRQVRNRLGASACSASIRGEEMMAGEERVALEEKVWAVEGESLAENGCQEAIIKQGQALFIPLRWWHSIKGLGTGVTGSVNWWFR